MNLKRRRILLAVLVLTGIALAIAVGGRWYWCESLLVDLQSDEKKEVLRAAEQLCGCPASLAVPEILRAAVPFSKSLGRDYWFHGFEPSQVLWKTIRSFGARGSRELSRIVRDAERKPRERRLAAAILASGIDQGELTLTQLAKDPVRQTRIYGIYGLMFLSHKNENGPVQAMVRHLVHRDAVVRAYVAEYIAKLLQADIFEIEDVQAVLPTLRDQFSRETDIDARRAMFELQRRLDRLVDRWKQDTQGLDVVPEKPRHSGRPNF